MNAGRENVLVSEWSHLRTDDKSGITRMWWVSRHVYPRCGSQSTVDETGKNGERDWDGDRGASRVGR